jgi:Ser/Thr protein kinase RdoA (MazF antagonist)
MSTISFFGTLVDMINQHYDLPEIVELTAIPSPRSHTSDANAVYRITTISNSFVLRPYRTVSSSAIDLHNIFLKWAAGQPLPFTQRLIVTRWNDDFFEHANRRWWLSSYIEADDAFQWNKPEWNQFNCASAGAALARLHSMLRTFEGTRSIQSPAESVLDTIENELQNAAKTAPQFKVEMGEVCSEVSLALQTINQTKTNSQLIHGDFHPGNLLFDTTVVAIIDFEYLHFEESIYDVAYGLIMFSTRWTNTGDDGQINPEFCQAFINGYTSAPHADNSVLFANSKRTLAYMTVAAAVCLTWLLDRESDHDTAGHFINIVMKLRNLSTMDISQITHS